MKNKEYVGYNNLSDEDKKKVDEIDRRMKIFLDKRKKERKFIKC